VDQAALVLLEPDDEPDDDEPDEDESEEPDDEDEDDFEESDDEDELLPDVAGESDFALIVLVLDERLSLR
jgi:hypothetical protein